MEYQVTANPEVVVAPKVEGDPAEPGLAKGVVKLPGVLFVAIATMAPGAGAAYSISTGAHFGVEIGVRFGLILGLVEITVLVVMSVWMNSVSGDANSLSLFTTSHANIPGFQGI